MLVAAKRKTQSSTAAQRQSNSEPSRLELSRRAAYNRIYYRTTFSLGRGCLVGIVALSASSLGFLAMVVVVLQRLNYWK